jgi:hypothetical protein
VDEKAAIHALDRLDPVLPLPPEQAERHGSDYRHGTLSLYAALETRNGQVIGSTASRRITRRSSAFSKPNSIDLSKDSPSEQRYRSSAQDQLLDAQRLGDSLVQIGSSQAAPPCVACWPDPRDGLQMKLSLPGARVAH